MRVVSLSACFSQSMQSEMAMQRNGNAPFVPPPTAAAATATTADVAVAAPAVAEVALVAIDAASAAAVFECV